ncbi:MAG: glycoside hydrolase family 65 protein [Peptoclostridium sp.]|uniref:family 65 glycosyl hydrolase domain-containing protein n=1 Tax=Peptoclostridium sp. TaxID=1904860 RepID=UPI00139F0B6A|nr:family 65 glycosyl hydrolase domain-containing protein [Peptoclostridium sp.]MZQ75700.1 glycoside hydrolase family 65 protein [Peptoclostridium sp.]
MKALQLKPWHIVQSEADFENNRVYESIMSLGNCHMGVRGNFEESFSGDGLKGTYLAGVYYPDSTKVGWWKNGYPEYYARIINSPDFIGIDLNADGIDIDMNIQAPLSFERTLDMREGSLERNVVLEYKSGKRLQIRTFRFLSMHEKECGCVVCEATPLDDDAVITASPFLSSNVHNEDSNWGDSFWKDISCHTGMSDGYICSMTRKSGFGNCVAMACSAYLAGEEIRPCDFSSLSQEQDPGKVSIPVSGLCPKGSTLRVVKFFCSLTNRDHSFETLESSALDKVHALRARGFESIYGIHRDAWASLWERCDIEIKGDEKLQSAARYCIFNMLQTYTGHDSRLNIGPKGFTGEKYGGGTYWDTEAFCFPFYLMSFGRASKALLKYRHKQLDKARGNARKLGLGGALYPMVTIDGDECHNEWEITFEEIHRNAAMAHAIYLYEKHTGDFEYIEKYGIDVLVETARFWASRASWSSFRSKYVILGVTGPNEYENNVNNNWYTNYMACWNMEYAAATLAIMKKRDTHRYDLALARLGMENGEVQTWLKICSEMYFPFWQEQGVFEQQDGYRDKVLEDASAIPKGELPISRSWSWDRILRSCFIKQADVLQAFYMMPENFSQETIKRNFEFYEPKTVHESSLSALVHSIVASRVCDFKKALSLFEHSVTLDLENRNADTADGLHITSMSGAYLCICLGFAGIRFENGNLSMNPTVPQGWDGYSFNMMFNESPMNISVSKDSVVINWDSYDTVSIGIFESVHEILPGENVIHLNTLQAV